MNASKISLASVLATGVLSLSSAFADDGEIDQHEVLFLLEEAYTQEEGETQASLTFDFSLEDDSWELVGEVEYGLSDRLQLYVEMPFEAVEGERLEGGHLEFGVDYALLKDGEAGFLPELTVGLGVVAPTGSDGEWLLEPSWRLAKSFSDRFYLHAGISAELSVTGDDDITVPEWTGGVGLGWRPIEAVTVTGELQRESEAERIAGAIFREGEERFALSVVLEPVDDLMIGAGLIQEIGEGDETRFVIKTQYEW